MNIDKLLESRRTFDEADEIYEDNAEEVLQPFIDRLNNAKNKEDVSKIIWDLDQLVPEGVLDISTNYQFFKNAIREINFNTKFFNNSFDREWVLAEWGSEGDNPKAVHSFGLVYPNTKKIRKVISEHLKEEVIDLTRLDSENYYVTTPTKKMEILIRKRKY